MADPDDLITQQQIKQRQEELSLKQSIENLEGRINGAYFDSEGKLTAGIGHLWDAEKDNAKYEIRIKPTGSTDNGKLFTELTTQELEEIQKGTSGSGKVAKNTETPGIITQGAYTITMTPRPNVKNAFSPTDAVDTWFNADFAKKEATAKRIFKDYDTYPLAIKEALMSGIYRGDFQKGYTTVEAINAGDFTKASQHFLLKGNPQFEADGSSTDWSKDYKKAVETGSGVQKRLEDIRDALKEYGTERARKREQFEFGLAPELADTRGPGSQTRTSDDYARELDTGATTRAATQQSQDESDSEAEAFLAAHRAVVPDIEPAPTILNKGGYMYNADGTKRNPNTTAHRLFNKGGEHMDEDEYYDDMGAQMEMSGLVQDEEVVDPVSGNDIPLGATAEGVRDDKTVALSAGEFVIPDYAVRYHGVDFYMSSLQRAKEGLAQMEDMGMTGKPEEAIMSADEPLPTMAGGGYAKNAALNVPIDTKMFEHGGLHSPTSLVQPLRPTVAPVPVRAPTDPRASFAQYQGLTVKEYKDPKTKKAIMVTMWNNQPYPPGTKVPEGFIPAEEADAIISAPPKPIAPATVEPTPVGPSEQDILEEEARDEAEKEQKMTNDVNARKAAVKNAMEEYSKRVKAITEAYGPDDQEGAANELRLLNNQDPIQVPVEHGMGIDGKFTRNVVDIYKYQNVRNHAVLSEDNPITKAIEWGINVLPGGAFFQGARKLTELANAYLQNKKEGNPPIIPAGTVLGEFKDQDPEAVQVFLQNDVNLKTVTDSLENEYQIDSKTVVDEYSDALDESGVPAEAIATAPSLISDADFRESQRDFYDDYAGSARGQRVSDVQDAIEKAKERDEALAPAPVAAPATAPVAAEAPLAPAQRGLTAAEREQRRKKRGETSLYEDPTITEIKQQGQLIPLASDPTQTAAEREAAAKEAAEFQVRLKTMLPAAQDLILENRRREEEMRQEREDEEERQRIEAEAYDAPDVVEKPEPPAADDTTEEQEAAKEDLYEAYMKKGGLVKKPKKKKPRKRATKKGKGLAKRK